MIKSAGPTKVRAVPMSGQNSIDGFYQIEIMDNGTWSTIIGDLSKNIAEDLIRQTVNRVICG